LASSTAITRRGVARAKCAKCAENRLWGRSGHFWSVSAHLVVLERPGALGALCTGYLAGEVLRLLRNSCIGVVLKRFGALCALRTGYLAGEVLTLLRRSGAGGGLECSDALVALCTSWEEGGFKVAASQRISAGDSKVQVTGRWPALASWGEVWQAGHVRVLRHLHAAGNEACRLLAAVAGVILAMRGLAHWRTVDGC